MQRAESYQEQHLVRSLFQQRLGRFHQLCSLSAAEGPSPEAYMHLDCEYPVPTDVDVEKGQEQLEKSNRYNAWVGIYSQFIEIDANEDSTLLAGLALQQNCLFRQLILDPSPQSFAADIVAFDRLRMELPMQSGHELSPSRYENERTYLQLTSWQTYCLISRINSTCVLTDFQREPLPNDMHWVDLSRDLPVRPQRVDSETLDDKGNEVLRQLFSDLQYRPPSEVPKLPARHDASALGFYSSAKLVGCCFSPSAYYVTNGQKYIPEHSDTHGIAIKTARQ